MSNTERNQQILNWLSKEKKKDEIDIKKAKETFIKEIKVMNKDDFFLEKKKKSTLWRKIRMLIWGY